jgi:hypothetical protein
MVEVSGMEATLQESPPIRVAERVPLVVAGQGVDGARLLGGAPLPFAEAQRVIATLDRAGVKLIFAVPSARWPQSMLLELGFRSDFEVGARNFYLGLSGISQRLDDRLQPFRRVAKLARRIRQKLIEVDFDDAWLAYAARLFEQRRPELAFSVDRTEEYLRKTYRKEQGDRLLVLRRHAGVGIDSFAVVRAFETDSGQRGLRLLDHWTRIGERRSTTWLLGELALWGLAEEFALIQAFAASGSVLDHLLIGAGCIKKPLSLPFFVRSLRPDFALSAAEVQIRGGDLELAGA